MKTILIPLILLVLGLSGGGGLAYILKQQEEEAVAEMVCIEGGDEDAHATLPVEPVPLDDREYARMNNQFVVPVMEDDQVRALMVLSLSIEVSTGGRQAVFAHEPRLRDAFLQAMFDHANRGGFSGAFTSAPNMRVLRDMLQEAADRVMAGHISDVLIIEIVRQDVSG